MKYICDKQMQIRRMYEETMRNLASFFSPHGRFCILKVFVAFTSVTLVNIC